MYRHLLVPSDGSENSKRATEHAAELAREHGARITILTAVPDTETGELDAPGMDAVERRLADASTEQGRAIADDTAALIADRSIDVSTVVVPGAPHRAICDFADETDVDLIVMGTRGRDSLVEYVLGSATERVTRLCDVPVLVV